MVRPGVATRPHAAAEADAPVGVACVAAGLLVGQLVAAKATRDAFFLSNFPVTTLPLASGLTAALSLGGVLAVSRAMPRWSPPVTMRCALALSALLLCAEWLLALAAPRPAALAVYAHAGVFGATLVSGFWSVINERFDPYTARHVIARIGTGASLGGVVGGLVTWRAAGVMGVPNMLLLLAALTLACLAVLERLPRGAPARPAAAAADARGPRFALALIRRHPYLTNVALLVSLCAVTETALDYVLSAAVTSRYSRGAALMSFFALYHTAVGVVALALQTILTRRALERLGLGGSLAVQPVVVAVGAAVAAAVPGLWPPVAVRATQAVLRSSVFRSAYELLYTPLPPEQKRPTKALLDVGADRLGAIAGSAAVLLALLFPARSTLLLLMLASALAVATTALARRLQAGYVSALAASLRAGTVRLDLDEVMDPTTRALLTSAGPRERPLPAEPAVTPPGPPSEAPPASLLQAAAALRSSDRDRIEHILRDPAMALELVPLVVPLLGRDDLFADAVASLRRVGTRCTGQLVDVLLDPQQDPVVRRRVPRVLKAVPTQRAADGLLAALRDGRFDVRYRSAQALAHLRHQDPSLLVPPATAFSAAREELRATAASARGLEHVFGLLALALPGEPVVMALRAWRAGDGALRGTALEYLHNVLPDDLSAALWPWLGARPVTTGRTLDDVRDDLLRSTSSFAVRGRLKKTGTAQG
jgi:ATP:ADP antiporter, AAA family